MHLNRHANEMHAGFTGEFMPHLQSSSLKILTGIPPNNDGIIEGSLCAGCSPSSSSPLSAACVTQRATLDRFEFLQLIDTVDQSLSRRLVHLA